MRRAGLTVCCSPMQVLPQIRPKPPYLPWAGLSSLWYEVVPCLLWPASLPYDARPADSVGHCQRVAYALKAAVCVHASGALGKITLRHAQAIFCTHACHRECRLSPSEVSSLNGGVGRRNWLHPVLLIRDEDLLQTAGLDALMFTRIMLFSFHAFLPIGLLGVVLRESACPPSAHHARAPQPASGHAS